MSAHSRTPPCSANCHQASDQSPEQWATASPTAQQRERRELCPTVRGRSWLSRAAHTALLSFSSWHCREQLDTRTFELSTVPGQAAFSPAADRAALLSGLTRRAVTRSKPWCYTMPRCKTSHRTELFRKESSTAELRRTSSSCRD